MEKSVLENLLWNIIDYCDVKINNHRKLVVLFKLALLIGILTLTAYSQQIELINQSDKYYSSTDSDSSSAKITTEKKLINYYGIHLGYFPDIFNGLYNSHGFGAMVSSDNYTGSFFNWG